jgi:hypothetical protein
MEHFFGDYQDAGATPEPALSGIGLGDDIGSFADSLNSAIDGIQAQDNALIAEYGHPADASDVAGDTAQYPASDAMDQSDQTFLNLLGQAGQGTAGDETNAWADNLTGQVNAMQDQTDAAISYAEHSPGFGEVNPNAADTLNAFGVADGISASDYEDFEGQQAQTDAADAISDASQADAEASDV